MARTPEHQDWINRIAAAVRKAREAKKLDIPQAAKAAGVPIRFLQLLEAGSTSPSFLSRQKLSNALSINLEAIKYENRP